MIITYVYRYWLKQVITLVVVMGIAWIGNVLFFNVNLIFVAYIIIFIAGQGLVCITGDTLSCYDVIIIMDSRIEFKGKTFVRRGTVMTTEYETSVYCSFSSYINPNAGNCSIGYSLPPRQLPWTKNVPFHLAQNIFACTDIRQTLYINCCAWERYKINCTATYTSVLYSMCSLLLSYFLLKYLLQ